MKAEIISIGDELLIGQTINTNASWLGSELALINIKVEHCQTISDKKEAIFDAFELAFKRSDLIIVTGGLGPTKDDITKQVLCNYFNTELEINPFVLERIEAYFEKRNRKMLDVNIQQAALPKTCTIILNDYGTASGMWFEKNGKILVSLPGVPYEMKGMMQDHILEKIKEQFKIAELYHETCLTTGMGESYLAEEMKDWETKILSQGFDLAYLPSPGMVRLRITSKKGKVDASVIAVFFDELKERLPKHVYGKGDESLIEVLGKLLKEKSQTISTIESCTGGGIANEITSISGSSEYFKGSLVAYTENVKISIAGVREETIKNFGVVSKETVEEMALSGLKLFGTNYALSSTGIAGPLGGTEENPVGTIWVAAASSKNVVSQKLNLGENRERNIKMTIFAALNLLRFSILENKL